MFESMGLAGDGWVPRAVEVLNRGLDDRRMAAFVIDHPQVECRLVSAGVGVLIQRMPGPASPCGRAGYIQYVCTDPEYRARGLARQVMRSLLEWFRQNGVAVVELHATAVGEPLYRSMGFGEAADRHLQLRLI